MTELSTDLDPTTRRRHAHAERVKRANNGIIATFGHTRFVIGWPALQLCTVFVSRVNVVESDTPPQLSIAATEGSQPTVLQLEDQINGVMPSADPRGHQKAEDGAADASRFCQALAHLIAYGQSDDIAR